MAEKSAKSAGDDDMLSPLTHMVRASPGNSWNLKRVLESPGILQKFWKSPGISLWSNSPKEISK